MIEVLLIKELNNNIEIINTINSISPYIKLFKILSNINEILSVVSNNSINILIIDELLLKKLDVVEFSKIETYVNSIIILTNNLSNTNFKNKCIFSTEEQLANLLTNYLHDDEFTTNEKNLIMNKIANELKYLGYNLSYYGTKYLIDCIYYLYKHEDYFDEITIKSIYSILAKKYKKNENTIKCNITRATSIMFCECEENKLKKYLGMCCLPKTGSKIIIETILNKIRYS